MLKKLAPFCFHNAIKFLKPNYPIKIIQQSTIALKLSTKIIKKKYCYFECNATRILSLILPALAQLPAQCLNTPV